MQIKKKENILNDNAMEDMRLRVRLINNLVDYIQQENLTILQAAIKFECSEATIYNLLQRKIWLLDIEELQQMSIYCYDYPNDQTIKITSQVAEKAE